jgi:GT2 family glycosyltransferase
VLLTPKVTDEAGHLQYLCKRYPSVLVLGLRGFAPRFVQQRFRGMLDRYEMRDVIGESNVVEDIPIASGAFMFCRTAALRQVAGFDPGFFLYFEDFDLSLRLRSAGRIFYVPEVGVTHFGGHASRKGGAHIRMFAASALRFFRKHGWRRPDLA